MPKIYDYFGLIFLFYSNDHAPVHVHVRKGEYESKIEFLYEKGLFKGVIAKNVSGKKPLPDSLLTEAKKFAKSKESQITKKWLEFFAKNKKPICEKITKKV